MLTEVKSGNNTVRYAYNGKGKLTSVSLNGVDNYVTYSYSDENTNAEKVTATMKGNIVATTTKNAHGNVTSSTCGNRSVTNTYDTDRRLTCVNDSISGSTNFTYNDEGTVSSVSASGVSESYTYDAYNTPTSKSITGTGISHAYTYDYKLTAARELNSISVNGATVTPSLDALGRNTGKSISIGGNKIAEEKISYAKFGDHATNLPSTVRFATNGVFKESMQYRYDSMGNIIEVFENGRTACKYEYDALGRLTREDNVAFGKTTTWAYDNNGNILARYEYALTTAKTTELHMLDCTCAKYAYDDNSDMLLSYDDETFVYDQIGNPTTYRGKTATWEYGRQLKSYNGNTFTYDARGRRTGKNGITFTYDSNGNLIKQSNGLEFLYDHTGVFAVKHNGSTYFYRKDAQANIVALLDNTGTCVVKYNYDAWGKCQIESDTSSCNIGTLNPFRYRSYYFDTESNLYFLKTRYYDPEIGRFITIDDISYLDPNSINGLNLYAYCTNNPVMRVDATGCAWWNPFSWNWSGLFNSIGNAFSTAGQWLTNNVLNPVDNFFANNWDIVLGVIATIGIAALSIVTFGIGTVALGMLIGAIVGAGFGAFNAYINGDSILYGAFSGAFVGALSGIGGPGLKGMIFAGIASALGAGTASLVGDRVNNRPRDFKTAGLSALTAGVFSFLGNGFGNHLANAGPELSIQIAANFMGSFYFSSYIFIADAIVKTVSGG